MLRTLLFSILALSAALVQAQEMPYNPDVNADDLIGVEDVLGVLTLYGNELMQPDLQCDYEGTDFEELIVGVMDGSIILDSVYVEYLILDTLTYYTPGCPDLVVDPLVLERSYMMLPLGISYSGGLMYHTMEVNHFGFLRKHQIAYSDQSNSFMMYLRDDEVIDLPSYNHLSYMSDYEQTGFILPFPSEFTLDEDGFHCFGRPYDFANGAEYFRAIPFWHLAD